MGAGRPRGARRKAGDALGLSRTTIFARVARGWTENEARTTPRGQRPSRLAPLGRAPSHVTPAVRAAAAESIVCGEASVAEVADDLGISTSAVYAWLARAD